MRDIELLAPAGDLEKLKLAIEYGADAIYLGGEDFGLRSASKNFSLEDIEEAVKFAHARGVTIHVTLNIVPHNEDLEGVGEYAKELYDLGVDAVIVSDPGMFAIIRRHAPELPIHISTQASVTNYETIMFWYELGVRRVVLARELTLEEIKEIRDKIPEDMELEAFVHGAMCMAYSGRCLMSNYMTGRDANKGDCSHSCRFKYHVMEETRPGQYFPVYENEEGTFIFNSKDLCMIEHIEKLSEAGIDSFKIEGRVKSLYYVATVIGAYRQAIDQYLEDREGYEFDKSLLEEIQKVSHRAFTTGFYFGKDLDDRQVYETSSYIRKYDFIGMIVDYDEETMIATVEQRNRFFEGEKVEIYGAKTPYFEYEIKDLHDIEGKKVDVAPHPQELVQIKMDRPVEKYYLMRRVKEEK